MSAHNFLGRGEVARGKHEASNLLTLARAEKARTQECPHVREAHLPRELHVLFADSTCVCLNTSYSPGPSFGVFRSSNPGVRCPGRGVALRNEAPYACPVDQRPPRAPKRYSVLCIWCAPSYTVSLPADGSESSTPPPRRIDGEEGLIGLMELWRALHEDVVISNALAPLL